MPFPLGLEQGLLQAWRRASCGWGRAGARAFFPGQGSAQLDLCSHFLVAEPPVWCQGISCSSPHPLSPTPWPQLRTGCASQHALWSTCCCPCFLRPASSSPSHHPNFLFHFTQRVPALLSLVSVSSNSPQNHAPFCWNEIVCWSLLRLPRTYTPRPDPHFLPAHGSAGPVAAQDSVFLLWG